MNIANIIPHSLESEQSIIGSIIIDSTCINSIVEIVKPEHFYNRAHRIIYTAMIEMIGSKKPIDLITITEYLERKNQLEEAGGFTYVGDITHKTPGTSNVMSYCSTVIDRWNGRQIAAACNGALESIKAGRDYQETRKGLYSELESLFHTKGENDIANAEMLCSDFTDELERIISRAGDLTGWSTGDIHIDEATGGLMPGDYVGLAARSGGGKTTKAINILTHFALNDRRCLFFSMEMKRQKAMMKICSDVGNVPFNLLKNGDLNDYQWAGVTNAMGLMRETKLHIDDSSGLTIDDIERKARQLKAKYGTLDLIVVDYLQRIKINTLNMYQELTNASNRLKDLFMELNCAGIVLAQLKKNSTGFPNASDLRETGAIENDSDLLIFLHTPSEDLKPHTGMLTAEIFNKVRFGETGVKMLNNELGFQRFTCNDEEYQEPRESKF
jgi:replicative DNA helicase